MAYQLDMHGLLNHIDRRDFNYYSSLSDEEKKGFKGVVALRWLGSTSGPDQDMHLWTVNQIVNQHFYDLASHPGLQYQLMASCGSGKPRKHDWIPMAKVPSRRSIVHEFLLELHPSANDFELEILFADLDKTQLERLMLDCALLPDRTKALRDAFKKTKKA